MLISDFIKVDTSRAERIDLIRRLEYNYKNEIYNDMDVFWVKDGRKQPEEEYFRLCCLALKIVCIEKDSEFYFSVRTFLLSDTHFVSSRYHPPNYS